MKRNIHLKVYLFLLTVLIGISISIPVAAGTLETEEDSTSSYTIADYLEDNHNIIQDTVKEGQQVIIDTTSSIIAIWQDTTKELYQIGRDSTHAINNILENEYYTNFDYFLRSEPNTRIDRAEDFNYNYHGYDTSDYSRDLSYITDSIGTTFSEFENWYHNYYGTPFPGLISLSIIDSHYHQILEPTLDFAQIALYDIHQYYSNKELYELLKMPSTEREVFLKNIRRIITAYLYKSAVYHFTDPLYKLILNDESFIYIYAYLEENTQIYNNLDKAIKQKQAEYDSREYIEEEYQSPSILATEPGQYASEHFPKEAVIPSNAELNNHYSADTKKTHGKNSRLLNTNELSYEISSIERQADGSLKITMTVVNNTSNHNDIVFAGFDTLVLGEKDPNGNIKPQYIDIKKAYSTEPIIIFYNPYNPGVENINLNNAAYHDGQQIEIIAEPGTFDPSCNLMEINSTVYATPNYYDVAYFYDKNGTPISDPMYHVDDIIGFTALYGQESDGIYVDYNLVERNGSPMNLFPHSWIK